MALPLLCSERHDALGFDADLQQLYAAIVTQGNARKRKLSEECSAEEVATKQPELISNSPDGGPVGGEQAERVEKRSNNGEAETCGGKTANRPKVQPSLPVTSSAAERPASKPKKKKVGLFR